MPSVTNSRGGLRQEVATAEGREASRSHISDSQSPGEGRMPERPGQTENSAAAADDRDAHDRGRRGRGNLSGDPLYQAAASSEFFDHPNATRVSRTRIVSAKLREIQAATSMTITAIISTLDTAKVRAAK